MMKEQSVAPNQSFDGTVVRPSRIPAEFKLVMTQEMKEWREILRETMFEYHRNL